MLILYILLLFNNNYIQPNLQIKPEKDRTFIIRKLENIPVRTMIVSSDGSMIYYVIKDKIFAYNVNNKKEKQIQFKGHNISNILLSNNNRYLAIKDGSGEFGVYDLEQSKYHSLSMIDFYWGSPESIYFSNSSRYLLLLGIVNTTGRVVMAYDIEKRKIGVIPFGHETKLFSDLIIREKILKDVYKKSIEITELKALAEKNVITYDCLKGKVVDDETILSKELCNKYNIRNLFSCYFQEDQGSILCITPKHILRISTKNKTVLAKFSLPSTEEKITFLRSSIKLKGKNILVVKAKRKNKTNLLYVLNPITLKQVINPIPVEKENSSIRYSDFDISPSGNFIVFVNNNKILLKRLQ